MTDLLGGDAWKQLERAFFAEESAPVGQPLPPRQPPIRYMTVEERRQARISEGRCPRGCTGTLEDGACGFCGWSLTEELLRQRLERGEAA